MNKKKIKCIVMDFDNTLYSNGDWSHEHETFGKYFVEKGLLPEYETAEEKLAYIEELYPQYHIIQGTFAYLRDNGIDDSEYRQFNEDNICEIRGDDTVFVDAKVISELSKYYKLYVISDSSQSYLRFYMEDAGINLNNFEEILSNDYSDECYTKLPMMKKVLKDTGLKPDEILMIGDSAKSDITPAKLMGFQTQLVANGFETEKILQELNNLKSSKKV